MTHRRAEHLEAVLAAAGDPRRGLPEDVFRMVSRITPLVNVDLLIQDERGRTLLTWRDDEFYGPGWHLPGSIIRFKEPAAARVRACARDELGADIDADPQPIHVLEGISDQETRGHHVSLLYRCRLLTAPDETIRAGNRPQPGQWRWHDRCPPDLLVEQREYARFF